MSAAVSPPPRIPDYELIRLIGTGSYGDVWLARAITGAFRAVKIVWRDRFADPRPFVREFEGISRFAAISLREPSQLALLHASRDDASGMFFYVMELADDAVHGRTVVPESYQPLTLREVFARRGRLPATEVIALGTALARALASLHTTGLVHRDIKPSNVIFVGGVPKLADVGLVAAASTGQLTFVGTEGFVPPEGPGAPAADVFSLGKLLYELATGLDRNDFPRLPAGLGEWSDRREFLELNEVLLRASEGDARRRYPDAVALLEDLLLLQAGKSVRRLRRVERRLTRALRIAVALTVVAVVAGLGAGLERRRAQSEQRLRAAAEAERDDLVRRTLYANTLGNAQHALATGGYGKARELLRELRPGAGVEDLRGFEWHALWTQAQGDPARVWQETGPAFTRLALAPGGERLATLNAQRDLTLWNTATGHAERTINGVSRLAGFSADGRLVLGLDAGGRGGAWQTADGARRSTADEDTSQFALGPLGGAQMVALKNGSPAQLTVWDGDTGRTIARHDLATAGQPTPWEYFRGAVSPTRRQAVIAWIKGRSGTEFRLSVVELDSGGRERSTTVDQRVTAVGFDAAGAWAILAEDRRLWRADAAGRWGASDELLPSDSQLVVALEHGHLLVADREQLLWSDEQGAILRRGRGSLGAIASVVRDAERGTVFSGTQAGELRVWPREAASDAAAGRALWNSHAAATGAAFSPDSRALHVPLDGRALGVMDLESSAVRRGVAGVKFPVWADERALLGPADDGDGVLRVALDGSAAERRLAEAVGVLVVLASRDGATVCASDSRGRLWVQRGTTPPAAPLITEGFQSRYAMQLDGAARRLWHTGRDLRLCALDLNGGREIWRAALPALAPGFALSPDERRLAIPLENGKLELRDAATGTLERTLNLGGSTPQAVCWSPDGRRVFVAGSKGDIACVETQRWMQLHLFQLPTSAPLHWIAMSPDGNTLVAITKTGVLHLVRAR